MHGFTAFMSAPHSLVRYVPCYLVHVTERWDGPGTVLAPEEVLSCAGSGALGVALHYTPEGREAGWGWHLPSPALPAMLVTLKQACPNSSMHMDSQRNLEGPQHVTDPNQRGPEQCKHRRGKCCRRLK